MIFYLGGNVVTWSSHKQKTVAHSSSDVKYFALPLEAHQGVWLRDLVIELTRNELKLVKIIFDIKSSISL